MSSRAIVMRRTGSPDVLTIESRTFAGLAAGEARVKTLAAAVNHSDLHVRAGDWPIRKASPFPYVPGLEVVGDVVAVDPGVTEVHVGDRVWTTMQGLGGVRAERDGGYAEYVTVAASALAVLPPDTEPVGFAALGLAGVTALEALRRVGEIAGRTVLITGVTGGVGAVAVELARAKDATVVPWKRGAALPAAASVDAVLDGVAGPVFGACVAALRPGGTYCLYGAAAGGDVAFDAWALLERRTLLGYSSEDLDGDALRTATRELLALAITPPQPTVLPLADAARAHALLEQRAVTGRIVLVP